MDRARVHRRLARAGLPEPKVAALTELLWNVHVTGRLHEVDFARLSDAGFGHLDVCVMRELLAAALDRRAAPAPGNDPVGSILGAMDKRGEGVTRHPSEPIVAQPRGKGPGL